MTNREKIDINIIYAGPAYISSELSEMKTAVKQAMTYDYNGDGEKGIQITGIVLLTDDQLSQLRKEADELDEDFLYNPNDLQDSRKKFELEIFSGESIICLLDPYWFNFVIEGSGLMPLEQALGYKPDNMINEYGIYLKDTEFGKFYSAFEILPDDTVLCIRRMTTTTIFKSTSNEEERYGHHIQMFKDILNFKLK